MPGPWRASASAQRATTRESGAERAGAGDRSALTGLRTAREVRGAIEAGRVILMREPCGARGAGIPLSLVSPPSSPTVVAMAKTEMSRFPIHDDLTAPEGSLPILKGASSAAGQ